MAKQVIWSYEAATDLEALAAYIAKNSTYYAAAFVQEILEASRSLDVFSERGRVVPELGSPSIRELFIREYRLIYQIEASQIVVLGLIHGKRDLQELWGREKRS